MTPADVRAQLQQRTEECVVLKQLWQSVIPEFCPDDRQFGVWLGLHNFERMVNAVKSTGAKCARLSGAMTPEHSVKFCSRVANVLRTEADQRLTTGA